MFINCYSLIKYSTIKNTPTVKIDDSSKFLAGLALIIEGIVIAGIILGLKYHKISVGEAICIGCGLSWILIFDALCTYRFHKLLQDPPKAKPTPTVAQIPALTDEA